MRKRKAISSNRRTRRTVWTAASAAATTQNWVSLVDEDEQVLAQIDWD
jgi:hypothetical protein